MAEPVFILGECQIEGVRRRAIEFKCLNIPLLGILRC